MPSELAKDSSTGHGSLNEENVNQNQQTSDYGDDNTSSLVTVAWALPVGLLAGVGLTLSIRLCIKNNLCICCNKIDNSSPNGASEENNAVVAHQRPNASFHFYKVDIHTHTQEKQKDNKKQKKNKKHTKHNKKNHKIKFLFTMIPHTKKRFVEINILPLDSR